MILRQLATIALALGWLAALAAPVKAGLGIMPQQIAGEDTRSWFVYTLDRGQSQRDTVVINNHSDESAEIVIEALDAISTDDGSYGLVSSPVDNQHIGKWVTLDRERVVLGSGKSAEVGFTIRIPADASVGEHNGGIVIHQERTQPASGSSINVQTRVAARVYVTVPGVVEREIEFDRVSHRFEDGKLCFTIEAHNKSNVKLEPSLDIRLTGLLGSTKHTEENVGTFLAGKEMKIERMWPKSTPKIGYYRVHLTLHTWAIEQTLSDGTTSQLPDVTFEYTFGFWVGSPLIVWGIVIILLGWLAYRVWAYLWDRNKYRTNFKLHTAKKDETIVRIAELTKVKPQYLIKINSIGWPYIVNRGDKILVPQGKLTPFQLEKRREKYPLPSFLVYLVSWRPSLYRSFVSRAGKK